MTIQYEDCTDTVELPLASIKQHGADGEFANDLSGLRGCSSSGGRSRSNKRTKTTSKPAEPPELHCWAVDVMTRLFVRPNTGAPTSVASRTFMVYDSSMFIDGEWVPQEEATINMLETLNDPIAGDVWSCAHLKFMHEARRLMSVRRPSRSGMRGSLFTLTMSTRRLPWWPPQLQLLLLLPMLLMLL
jgi:hypothetical protein